MNSEFSIKLSTSTMFSTMTDGIGIEEFKKKVEIWGNELIQIFSVMQLKIVNSDIEITFDWTEFVEEILISIGRNIGADEVFNKYYQYVDENNDEEIMGIMEFSDSIYGKHSNEFIFLKGNIKANSTKYEMSDLIRITLFHIWCSINLSLPGGMSFLSSEFIVNGETKDNIALASDILQYLFISEYNKFRKVKILSLSSTWKWYQEIVDLNQLSTDTNFERAIACLFHYIRKGSLDPVDSLYVFMGLESFYNLGNNQIKTALKNRTVMFLDINDYKKEFKKLMGDFYDYRSRLVHGNLNVTMCEDTLLNGRMYDPSVSNNLKQSDIGIYILIVSIQKSIEENRNKLSFCERIK